MNHTSDSHISIENSRQRIELVVNGENKTYLSPITLLELVMRDALRQEGTAIAYNQSIVSRCQWSNTHLKDGDQIDIFTLVAGG
ncbi:sulfur carrier protein ThiS [Alteromonas hispanica]|jgi:sulfur carrier protein|uniref:Sulfur carrier protein ThiS n=1 Tax=Alteromonas hispanica TaxID=315421 RepID=A0A6L9MZ84_9ALTE|nr:sulfur carrier protein ThiS [Alteromonas hispanica]NDW23010.1 sulfur carrier protein ThiS [Alteromonas hispanica]